MSVGDLLERDAERPAYVRFEVRAVPDPEATLREGHHVSKDEHWILVTPPYSKDCVEKKVANWFAQKEIDVKNGRVNPKHLDMWKESYSRWKNGLEEPLNGTSVKEWNALSPAQCKNLISAGCRTIEDVAMVNDEGLKRIGIGGIDLKNKARAWLQAAKDHGPLVNEVTKLKNENAQLMGAVESLTEQVAILKRHLESTAVEEVPRGTIENISADDILGTPAERYESKFGSPPHHRMKPETILKKLEE